MISGIRRGLVSVIIPVYKAERFIRDCLESILAQTYAPIEIIIIYDPSPDRTLEILKRYREKYGSKIKIILQKRKTRPSVARNVGIKYSSGEYLAFCDADDFMDESKIERQVEYLDSKANIDLVYTDFIKIDANGREIERVRCPDWSRSLWLSKHFICFSSLMVRRAALEKIKIKDYYFDERLPAFDDYDLLIRLSKITDFGRVPGFLTYYRVHSESLSTKTHEMNVIRAKIELKHNLLPQFMKSAFFIIPKDYFLMKIPHLRPLYSQMKKLVKKRGEQYR